MIKKNRSILFQILASFLLFTACKEEREQWHFESETANLVLEVVADSIRVPFGMCFLSDTEMLVSNRFHGEIYRINYKSGEKTLVKGVPPSYNKGDGGALGILPHPNFEENGWLFFAHSIGDSTSSTLAIERGKLIGNTLNDIKRIFTAQPYYKGASHYGCRMVFKQNHLYFTMGDRYDLMDSAQTLNNHLGKVIRITADGRIPEDNPFVDRAGAKAEIWSYGHRNPQGMTLHPETGEIWLHEHGPKGGDEINRIKPGLNYGWPVICYGIDYDDSPIGEGITHKEGMEQPIHYYTPSIAPSGMDFYYGDKFPQWKGNLFLGAMAGTHLNRLVLEKNEVVHEERLLTDFQRRIRVVREGPDGYLYLGVDGGMILRLRPE